MLKSLVSIRLDKMVAILALLLIAACTPETGTLPPSPTPITTQISIASPTSGSRPSPTLTPVSPYTTPPPAPPTPTPLPPSQPEIQATVVAAHPPQVLESQLSPDGAWQAEVRRYDCVPTGPYEENALEEIALWRIGGQDERQIDEQFLNCGGVGAWGLGNLVWSSNSRYLYYTNARESVPDGYGICLWERPLVRLDVQTGDRLQLSYGHTSPSGDRWVMKQGQELVIWNYDQGQVARLASPLPGRVFLSVAWLPDERALVYALGSDVCMPFGPTRLGMVDLATGQHTLLVEDAPDLEFSLVQGGQALLYRTAETVGAGTRYYLHGLSLFYLDLRTRHTRLLAQASDMLSYRVGREGREIVYWADDATPEHPGGQIRLVYLHLDRMQERLLAETGGQLDYSFSLETGLLVYLEREHRGYGSGAYALVLVDLDSLAQTTLLAGQGQAYYSLSPDERSLAVLAITFEGQRESSSSLSLVDLSTRQVTLLLESDDPVFQSVYWEDNDTLSLDWQGCRFHLPTGQLICEQ